MFAHVTAPNAEMYRAVMRIFGKAKARFMLHLRPEDLLAELQGLGFHYRPNESGGDEKVERVESSAALDRDTVSLLLESLESWGNLRAYQDTVEVATVQDFMRKRFLYQMTSEGEAAEEALAVFEEHLARPGELQASALQDIQLHLTALDKLAGDSEPDPAGTASVLGEICRRFEQLTSQAQRFMNGLQRHIDL